jgi:hypothetical protein
MTKRGTEAPRRYGEFHNILINKPGGGPRSAFVLAV